MPPRGAGALLQGGLQAGGRGDVQGGVPVLRRGGERGAAGEAVALPGRGGAAPGEGDLAPLELVLRGAGAASGPQRQDRGRMCSDSTAQGDDSAPRFGSRREREADSGAEWHQDQPPCASAETEAYIICQPSCVCSQIGTFCYFFFF